MKKRRRMVDSNGIQCRAYIKIQDIDKFLAEMKQKLLKELDENMIITLS